MVLLLLLAAASCPQSDLVVSSAGLGGIRAGEVEALTPETVEAWLSKQRRGCPAPTLWLEEELSPPPLPAALAGRAPRRFPKESSAVIREEGFSRMPAEVQRLYPHPKTEPVGFLDVTLDQPTARPWTGAAYQLHPQPQVDITPPYATVRSSKINYAQEGFSVTWEKARTWLAVGGWPLPIRFIDDGRAPLPVEPVKLPLERRLGDARAKSCTALALVTTARGLTAVDGAKATLISRPQDAKAWLRGLRAKGCRLPLTWWHPAGTPEPAADAALGPVTFATFDDTARIYWGEEELRKAPAKLLELTPPGPGDMTVQATFSVPFLSVCGDPPGGPGWKPPPPFLATLDVQPLRVEAPFAVFEPKSLLFSGLESTSGRCPPRWVETEVLLRIPPTALPVRIGEDPRLRRQPKRDAGMP